MVNLKIFVINLNDFTIRNKISTVVDVYSEWCGPCTAMASHLKEIKLQLGDDFLHCALVSSSSLLLDCVQHIKQLKIYVINSDFIKAKADCISQLSRFRGRSEPTWLFVAVS